MKFDYGNFMKDLNKSIIVNSNPELGIFFNSAMSDAIKDLQNKIIENDKYCEELHKKLLSKEYEETGIPNEIDQTILEDQAECSMHSGWLTESLTSINEMRIINLYKSFEIEIKQILEQAYPNVNKKDFYRWDILVNYLKSINIIIKDIKGYNETNQLRIINNQIKHRGSFTNEVKFIPEFYNSDRFTFENINLFYSRIYQQVNNFLSKLSSEIYRERYEFDEERITKITLEYKERMDKETINKLIEKLAQ